MAESEILDIVDKDGNILGQAPRSEFHKNPNIIHKVVHCWIFNKKGKVLWQQRSMKKAMSPGVWDMSCGGHVKSGSTLDETMATELEEELGLVDLKFNFIEKYIDGDDKQTELIYLYYAIVDKREKDFKLQEIEVERVEWIDVYRAQEMVINKERESTRFIFTQVPRILQRVFAERV